MKTTSTSMMHKMFLYIVLIYMYLVKVLHGVVAW